MPSEQLKPRGKSFLLRHQCRAVCLREGGAKRSQLANAGKSLEALGIGFSTVPAAGGAASETTHISDLLSNGQSAFRMSVPARAGVAAYGIQVQSAVVAGGAHRVSIAAYDVGFSRRLGMQSVSFSPTEDSAQIRLRMERAAKTLANSVPRDGRHTSLFHKVYDAVVPSAEAGGVGIAGSLITFIGLACVAFTIFSAAADFRTLGMHTESGACIVLGLVVSASAVVSAYFFIQAWNNPD